MKKENILYIFKKLLIFLAIYVAANVLQQVVLTGLLYLGGYDPVQGILPSESVQTALLYYGFAVYLLLAFLYCRVFEKRGMKTMGFTGQIGDYLSGAGIAVVILLLILGICFIFRGISFAGIHKNTDALYMILLLGGIAIQGAAEEAVCRGFLMTSLMKKVSVPAAIFWSATAFAFPHFFNLFTSDAVYVIVGIVNLYLISSLFSLLMLLRKNIWIACGLHSIWNFLLYGVFGLDLSGNAAAAEGILEFRSETANILNGGSYGLESSIITTLVLGLAMIIAYRIWRQKRSGENGVQ